MFSAVAVLITRLSTSNLNIFWKLIVIPKLVTNDRLFTAPIYILIKNINLNAGISLLYLQ